MMMHGFGGGIGFGMGFGWIFWLIIVGVAIWAVVRITNHNSYDHSGFSGKTSQRETPLDILKKRYARGEITDDEFKEMKRNL